MGRSLPGWFRVAAATGRLLLTPGRLLLLVRVSFWIAFISLASRVISLGRLFTIISPRQRARQAGEGEIAATVNLIDRAFRLDWLMFRPSCWKRAFVIHRYLRLAGVESSVSFGVKRSVDALQGHAWIEIEGQPAFETIELDYHQTLHFEGAKRAAVR